MYSNSSSSTIQIKYRDDETGVYYANVNKISEYKTYLGIPVVLTFRLLDKKYIGLDLDISAEFSYKIYSVISFDFTDPSMKEIKNEAADAIKAVKINDYSWSSAVGLMLRVGKIDKVHGKIGFDFPAYYYSENYLLTNGSYPNANFKASIVIPLNK